ncbi:ATP-binding protein [Actinomadura fulvescens]|uniref:ATP-binding protein n=1 Tax=Actinomadura fulvescens TaxID=46160 RepID=A0ABN3PXP7_9ACTN
MLLRFRAANHRSFRDEFELWTSASRFNQGSGRPSGLHESPEVAYLPVTVIYGANASGKSNTLHAMRWMRQAVLFSVHEWSSLDGVPRDPFELDPAAREETSLFEADIVVDGDRFVYGFEVSDERIETEWLHAYPGGQARKQVWFERDADREDAFQFPGEGLKGAKESLVPQTRANALFLTVAAAFNHPHLGPVHDWFKRNIWWVSPGRDVHAREGFTKDKLADATQRDRILQLLASADLGVIGAELEPDLRLIHQGAEGGVPLDFERQESMGTRSWFAFIGPMLEALDHGSTLLVDELDTSLHPLLAAEVIRLFQDEDANPRGAQLICTTHDATLLGNAHPVQALERDQVRLTVKKRNGQSEIYPLTDARPRKTEPLDRHYLSGSYGAIPRISTNELAADVSGTIVEAKA